MKLKIQELLLDSKKFREKLVSQMENLERSKIDCSQCTGICCTVARNSMQITPIEALDIYFYIEDHIKDQTGLKLKMKDSISQFLLDREIYVKGLLLRKNYTCPLFKFESWGCPIDKNLKPLGCLGYNALAENVIDGENCSSDIKLLNEVEVAIKQEWDELNNKLRALLGLDFIKLPIPRALEEIQKKLNN